MKTKFNILLMCFFAISNSQTVWNFSSDMEGWHDLGAGRDVVANRESGALRMTYYENSPGQGPQLWFPAIQVDNLNFDAANFRYLELTYQTRNWPTSTPVKMLVQITLSDNKLVYSYIDIDPTKTFISIDLHANNSGWAQYYSGIIKSIQLELPHSGAAAANPATAWFSASTLINKIELKAKRTTFANAKNYKIVILAGQSNAVGHAKSKDFPIEYKHIQKNIKIWDGSECDDFMKNKWMYVQVGFGTDSARTGSEISFAKAITQKFPNDSIRIIKAAWSATSLAEGWLSPSIGIWYGGNIYRNFFEMSVNPALQSIISDGNTYEIVGMLWLQGESDALLLPFAKAYSYNLTHFIKDIRKDLQTPEMPFIIAKIDESPAWPYYNIVRQAEDSVAANIPNIGIFDTKDFETDGAHYYPEGIIKVGIGFANELSKFFKGNSLSGTPAIYKKETNQLKIYPNPANNLLTIISEKSLINIISITDAQGRIVSEMTKNQFANLNYTFTSTIDISSLTSGIYFLNIKTEDKIIVAKKFIKF